MRRRQSSHVTRAMMSARARTAAKDPVWTGRPATPTEEKGDDAKKSRSESSSLGWTGLSGVLLLFVIGVLLYQTFRTDCIVNPDVKGTPDPPPLVGALSADFAEKITDGKKLFPDVLIGPECMVWDPAGNLYTGSATGQIWKVAPGASKPEVVASTGKKSCGLKDKFPSRECGLPLGLRYMPDHSLLIADAFNGLMQLSLNDSKLQTLLPYGTEVGGVRMLFADDVVVGPDGAYYLTDASTDFGFELHMYSVINCKPDARVIRYDPLTKTASVFVSGLHFANGIEVSNDGKSLIVSETSIYRIRRIPFDDPSKIEYLVENLPGYPDNIRHHPDGGYLVAFPAMRGIIDTTLDNCPALKRLLVNVLSYHKLISSSDGYALCVHVSDDGKVVRSWHGPEASVYSRTSHCAIHDGHLYTGSFKTPGMMKVKLH